jgi:large subunit ribosomal protein L29
MALPKIDEVRDLSDQELEEQIVATKKQLFELRFQKGTRRLEKPHQFKHFRHRLAQLMTVERERQLKAASGDE